jgi:hypothetical protein
LQINIRPPPPRKKEENKEGKREARKQGMEGKTEKGPTRK